MLSLPDHLSLDAQTKENIQAWLEGTYDEEAKRTIQDWLKNNPESIIDAFYKKLSFGTGGLRGIMGVGSNRMNIYTVRAATQGLSNYLLKQFQNQEISVLIGYDSRLNSKTFAEESAKVFAGNKIKVYLFTDLRPLPVISFGCRHLKCNAAVMITASHNPPEYNGYKVFWDHGSQVLPPHDQGIIQEVDAIQDNVQIKLAESSDPLIHLIDREIDAEYLESIDILQLYREENQNHGEDLHIIYSSLHGTGITMVPKALGMWGFHHVNLVQSQAKPDGHFPTVKVPNPEMHASLHLGVEQLIQTDSDLLLATDPDCDRLGVAFKDGEEVSFLDGNTMVCLCLEHICWALQSKGISPEHPAYIKTIVTTELFKEICDHYSVACFEVLTGFKYIAQMINEWEDNDGPYRFVFGGEESYGCLFGIHARDKDAVIASCLISEIALRAKRQGKTLLDLTYELYEKYGVYRNQLLSIKFSESREGHQKMTKAVETLRASPPQHLLGTRVEKIEDYFTSKSRHLITGEENSLHLPKSNVLRFFLEDKTVIAVRPSGTEPKVKLYCGVTTEPSESIPLAIEHCDVLCSDYLQTLKSLMTNS
ncbi:MAG: phospho-sugar mutase [Chlamydiales bacterium]